MWYDLSCRNVCLNMMLRERQTSLVAALWMTVLKNSKPPSHHLINGPRINGEVHWMPKTKRKTLCLRWNGGLQRRTNSLYYVSIEVRCRFVTLCILFMRTLYWLSNTVMTSNIFCAHNRAKSPSRGLSTVEMITPVEVRLIGCT